MDLKFFYLPFKKNKIVGRKARYLADNNQFCTQKEIII